MTKNQIHSVIFKQPWKQCSLRLVNGDVITVDHPHYLLMPPRKDWVLWVKPDGDSMQFVPTEHIAAIDLEPRIPGKKR